MCGSLLDTAQRGDRVSFGTATMSNRYLECGVIASLALGTPACGDASSAQDRPALTGGQTGDDGGSDPLVCEVVSATPLSFEEPSVLAFAASAAAPLVTGVHVVPLEWAPVAWWNDGADPPTVIEYGPESGLGEVRLEIELDEDSARFVDLEDARSPGNCRDRVELDANIALETAGGAFRERFRAPIDVMTGEVARLEHPIPGPALAGGFQFDTDSLGELRATEYVVYSWFTRYGAVGDIAATLESDEWNPGSASRQRPTVAGWPAPSPCAEGAGVPMVDTSESPSMDDLIRAVGGSEPMAIFVDGVATAPLELALSATDRWACFAPAIVSAIASTDVPFWTVGAELQLRSDALPALPPLPVRLTGQTPAWSTQFGVSFAAGGPCAQNGAYSVAQFTQHCGDWGFDLSAYDAAHLEFRDTSFTQKGGYATALIIGEKWPGCTWGSEGRSCPDGGAGDWTSERVGSIHFGSLNRE
jgi:hypothetical protein